MASRLLGGDFVCGEMVWWRGDRIPVYLTALPQVLDMLSGRPDAFVHD